MVSSCVLTEFAMIMDCTAETIKRKHRYHTKVEKATAPYQ
jgi:hypothetical protein